MCTSTVITWSIYYWLHHTMKLHQYWVWVYHLWYEALNCTITKLSLENMIITILLCNHCMNVKREVSFSFQYSIILNVASSCIWLQCNTNIISYHSPRSIIFSRHRIHYNTISFCHWTVLITSQIQYPTNFGV